MLRGGRILLLKLFNSKIKLRAFGLVEVLISVVILAIGLLGLASLQNATIQSVQEGDNLVSASLIAQEMAKRMLSNRYVTAQGRQGYLAIDLSGAVASAGGAVPWAAAVESANPSIDNCYSASASTSVSCFDPGGSLASSGDHKTALNNMQLKDQVEMRLLAANILPQGLINICFDSTNAHTAWTCDNAATRVASRNENVFTVKVQWTNILTNITQLYSVQFTAECDDASCS